MRNTFPKIFSVTRAGLSFAAALCLIAVCPGPVSGFKVIGKVTNGTTGRADVRGTVDVINPHRGMAVEQELEIIDGVFTTDNLSDTALVYLFRLNYKGVSYKELIRFEGVDPLNAQFEVYDTTSSWEGLRISIPHFLVRPTEDRLRFDKDFEIINASDPPKTVVGNGLAMYIPEDRVRLNTLYVAELGIPIKQEAIPTDSAGIYRLEYPFTPGVTRVVLSFDVPYTEMIYDYREVLPVDIEALTVLTDDPELKISSETTSFKKEAENQGFDLYSTSSLSKSSVLAIQFSGGGGGASPAAPEWPRIFVRSQKLERSTLPLVVVPALILLGLALFTAKKPISKTTEEKHGDSLKLFSDKLLNQIARLDDLYATGTIPETLYRSKRLELKSRLALILRRLNGRAGRQSGKTQGKREDPK